MLMLLLFVFTDSHMKIYIYIYNIFDRSFHYLQKNQNKMECLCDAVLQLRWMFTPLNWGLTVVWIGILFILTVCLFINKHTISNQKGIYSIMIFFLLTVVHYFQNVEKWAFIWSYIFRLSTKLAFNKNFYSSFINTSFKHISKFWTFFLYHQEFL